MHPFIAAQLVADHRAHALADAHHSRLVRAVAVNRPCDDRSRLGLGGVTASVPASGGLVAAIVRFAARPAGSGRVDIAGEG